MSQVLYFLWYRIFWPLDRPGKHIPLSDTELYTPTCVSLNKESQIGLKTHFGRGKFKFLNLAQDFGGIEFVDWNYSAHGKLWTYNLNYFEFLKQKDISEEQGQELIQDWIRKSKKIRDGWEPYPTSLRIVNWLCFFGHRGLNVPTKVCQSIYNQYCSLWNKRECHLKANHLLENGIALVMGAFFFFDQKKWDNAVDFLIGELQEQYNRDGSHFELSPVYHILLLWRLLDLYSWVRGNFQSLNQEKLVNSLKTSLKSQLEWLEYIIDESGQYPYFNDSTFDLAPEVKQVFLYARALGLSWCRFDFSPAKEMAQVRSREEVKLQRAYVHRKWKGRDVYVDLGPLGPRYQLGHGHADNLTFCLFQQGKRLIVDPGISTYDVGETRLKQRSTSYHNTISVGKRDSSEIWSSFRCGRTANTRVLEQTPYRILAEHDGYSSMHRRIFEFGEKGLMIEDQFPGSAKAWIHFGPDVELVPIKFGWVFEDLQIRFSEYVDVRLESYDYALGFNKLVSAQRLSVSFKNRLITTISQAL